MVLSALFLAISYLMPFLTGQIPEVGAMLCPMHIPVLLCGYICGPFWGLAVGIAAPIFRSLTLGMPPLFPTAVCMAFELCAYGAFAGFFHRILPKKNAYIYVSLLGSMLLGRLVWGASMLVCMSVGKNAFTVGAFLTGAFANAVPGIILQIVAVPVLVILWENRKSSLGENQTHS